LHTVYSIGLVPIFFEPVPDSSLEFEWQIFKGTQLEEGAISYDVGGNEDAAGICGRGCVLGNGGAFPYLNTPFISYRRHATGR
jgi:hypothetical protein